MSVHLPWDDMGSLVQSIILPRSTVALSIVTPSGIVSYQGGPYIFFPCRDISGAPCSCLKTEKKCIFFL